MLVRKYFQEIFSIAIKEKMKFGIIGGGINGLFIAWRLSASGHEVDIYESSKPLQQTSSASSKLLHGGIRYLEQGHFRLVRQSLIDRSWWLKNAPGLCEPIEILMPIYKKSRRSEIKLFIGAKIYELLAGRYSLGKSLWRSKEETISKFPDIKRTNLKGSVSFFDAQMNERRLGEWVLNNAKESGIKVFENTEIKKFTTSGEIFVNKYSKKKYDYIINAAGPWATKINKLNDISSRFSLDLIRGSHIILDKKISGHFLFQEDEGDRVVFVLPYLGNTLVGTTEVPQSIEEPIECAEEEIDYLLDIFNNNFIDNADNSDIISTISGLRPIVALNMSRNDTYYSKASREAELEVIDKLVCVFGGKWTSAPSLSKLLLKKLKL